MPEGQGFWGWLGGTLPRLDEVIPSAVILLALVLSIVLSMAVCYCGGWWPALLLVIWPLGGLAFLYGVWLGGGSGGTFGGDIGL